MIGESYKRIGLLDHMGMGNMGDAAVLEAFIINIKRRLPNAVLVAFSLYPDDTTTRHQIECHPIRWSYARRDRSEPQPNPASDLQSRLKLLFKKHRILYSWAKPFHDCIRELVHLMHSYRIVKALDVLILSGGGQLCDLHPSLPYNVFKFCLLAKLSNTPVFIIGVGVDRLTRRSSRFFAKWSVRIAEYASFRSVQSQISIRRLGVEKPTDVHPDPAYALDPGEYISLARSRVLTHNQACELLLPFGCRVSRRDSGTTSASISKPKVALNPMGFCDPRHWPLKNNDAYLRYLDKLQLFISWLIAQEYSVEIFTSDIITDFDAIEDLKKRLPSTGDDSSQVTAFPTLTLRDLFMQMSTADYIVTSKFHGVIFSHLLGKPVIALSYLSKIDDLMCTVGQGQYCLDIAYFEAQSLIRSFKSLVENADHVRTSCHHTTETYREAVHGQFDKLFGVEGSFVEGNMRSVDILSVLNEVHDISGR